MAEPKVGLMVVSWDLSLAVMRVAQRAVPTAEMRAAPRVDSTVMHSAGCSA